MDDTTYCYVSDMKERKRTAYSSSKKVTGKGRTVRLPSDNLTAKQRKELNGKVVTYNMDKPLSYNQLILLPSELQKEYLENIKAKYKPSEADLTRMLHVAPAKAKALLSELKIEWTKNYRSPSEKFEWRVFLGENITPPVEYDTKPKEQPNPEQTVPMRLGANIGQIDRLHLTVIGKPYAVANGLTLILDPNIKYRITIDAVEIEEEKTPNESNCCGAESAPCLEGA